MAEMITGKILFKGNDRILLCRAPVDFGQDVGAGWAPLCPCIVFLTLVQTWTS
jgi:hypothetical protein